MRFWIHGAFASPQSFNYFRTQMNMDDDIMIEYDWNTNLCQTVLKMKDYIESKTKDPVDLIGHSLGGVFCVILNSIGLKVKSINTLCAPFGGLEANFFLKLWFPKSVYSEIDRLQSQYSQLLFTAVSVPHQFFVGTRGSNPMFLGKQNDGVVSVASQTAIRDANYKMIESNHYEILMNQEVVDEIKSFYKGLKRSSQVKISS